MVSGKELDESRRAGIAPNAFDLTSTHQMASSANAGLEKTPVFFGFTEQPKQHSRSGEPSLPSPRGTSDPRGGFGSPRTERPDATLGREGRWPRAGDTARSLPVGPAAIPAPGRAGGAGQSSAGGSSAPRPPHPRPEPRRVPAWLSLRRAGRAPARLRAAARTLQARPDCESRASEAASSPPPERSMMAAAAVAEVSSAGSSSTDTSSTGEEERMRRLFHTCDGDGDGFISR